MFPSSLIAESRSRAMAEMKETATWYAPVTQTDDDGITATTYPAISSVSRCRLRMFTARERAVAGAEGEVIDGEVICPVNTPVGHEYRVIVSGVTNGESWSETLEVVGVNTPKSYHVEMRVSVKAIRTGTVG